jgi:hypothetical protein
LAQASQSLLLNHYSGAELKKLREGSNRVCEGNARKMPTLTLLKTKSAYRGRSKRLMLQ